MGYHRIGAAFGDELIADSSSAQCSGGGPPATDRAV